MLFLFFVKKGKTRVKEETKLGLFMVKILLLIAQFKSGFHRSDLKDYFQAGQSLVVGIKDINTVLAEFLMAEVNFVLFLKTVQLI